MKKSLLLSTALVAVFAATQTNADIYIWNEDQGTVNISDKISRETGEDTIVWVPGKISVGANSVFSGNKAETMKPPTTAALSATTAVPF